MDDFSQRSWQSITWILLTSHFSWLETKVKLDGLIMPWPSKGTTNLGMEANPLHLAPALTRSRSFSITGLAQTCTWPFSNSMAIKSSMWQLATPQEEGVMADVFAACLASQSSSPNTAKTLCGQTHLSSQCLGDRSKPVRIWGSSSGM